MSEEELAADAAAFAQAAMQEDAEAHPMMPEMAMPPTLTATPTRQIVLVAKASAGKPVEAFLLSAMLIGDRLK